MQGFLIIVYGENTNAGRENLWRNSTIIADHVQDSPWVVAVDFNSARYSSEKVGGKALSLAQLKPFNDCISYCKLPDLNSTG